MSVPVSSVFMLFRARSGLATGRSPVQEVLPTAYEDLEYQIDCDRNRPEDPIRKTTTDLPSYLFKRFRYKLWIFMKLCTNSMSLETTRIYTF
jgi:hypothetical protein